MSRILTNMDLHIAHQMEKRSVNVTETNFRMLAFISVILTLFIKNLSHLERVFLIDYLSYIPYCIGRVLAFGFDPVHVYSEWGFTLFSGLYAVSVLALAILFVVSYPLGP